MIYFREPWQEPANPSLLKSELEKELSAGHYLYQYIGQLLPVASSGAADDVVFEIRELGYVLVHLTWSGKNERTPSPTFTMLPTAADVQNHIDKENELY